MVSESGYCTTCMQMVSVTIGGICKKCEEPLNGAWDLEPLPTKEVIRRFERRKKDRWHMD